MSRRLRLAGLHFIASAGVAAVVAALVFLIWYPPPYAVVAGGLALFALIVSVDVVVGPALTAVIAGPAKQGRELRRDMVVIVVLQLVALGYGLYTMAVARPVYLVFEVDRLTVVNAVDIDPDALRRASPEFRSLPWTGPGLIAARRAVNNEEMLRSLDLSFSGVDIAMQPERWIPYDAARDAVTKAAHPVDKLLERYPQVSDEVHATAKRAGVALDGLRFLPLTSRHASWVALLAMPEARVVGYLPVDGFL